MNAIAASRHEEFAGRLQSTGNKAELYVSPMETGSNSRYKHTIVAPSEFPLRKINLVCVTGTLLMEALFKERLNLIFVILFIAVALRLVLSTPDRAIRVRALAGKIVL